MDREYLIHEKPLKALIVFIVPMIIGNLFQQFYTMVDSIVVGRYVSEQALAAVGACYSLTNVFIAIAIGGGTGAAVITGQCFGAQDYRRMKTTVYTALVSFVILSILLGSFGYCNGKLIMQVLNTPADIQDMSAVYLDIYFLGLPFLFMYNILSSMFNAIGRSRVPLYLLIFSSLLNVFLDIWMVRYLHLGVAGVAWATLIAQGISAVVSLVLFLRIMRTFPSCHSRLFDPGAFRRMAVIALPSILQMSTVSIGMMLVQSVVNGFGSEMLAGYSAAIRVENICNVPMSAMGNAMSPYTAQNLGAGRKDRIPEGYKAGLSLIVCFALINLIVLEFGHSALISMFLGSNGTAAALETGSSCLRFLGFFFVLIGMKMTTDGVLRGAGDMKMFTLANLTNLSIRVCLSIFLAPAVGISMVWISVPIGWSANFIISFSEYRTGKWKRIYKGNLPPGDTHNFCEEKR